MRSTFLAVFFSASCGFGLLVALGQPLAMPPGSGLDAPPGSPQTYAGKVIETMNSGGYTYIKLATPEGEIWGAVTPASVKVGDSAKIVSGVVMTDFEAKSLGRKFDRIVFGSLEAEASGSPHPGGRLGALSGLANDPMHVTIDGVDDVATGVAAGVLDHRAEQYARVGVRILHA